MERTPSPLPGAELCGRTDVHADRFAGSIGGKVFETSITESLGLMGVQGV